MEDINNACTDLAIKSTESMASVDNGVIKRTASMGLHVEVTVHVF